MQTIVDFKEMLAITVIITSFNPQSGLNENAHLTEMRSLVISRHKNQYMQASKQHSRHLYPRLSQLYCPWSHRCRQYNKSKHRVSLLKSHGRYYHVCRVDLPNQSQYSS